MAKAYVRHSLLPVQPSRLKITFYVSTYNMQYANFWYAKIYILILDQRLDLILDFIDLLIERGFQKLNRQQLGFKKTK